MTIMRGMVGVRPNNTVFCERLFVVKVNADGPVDFPAFRPKETAPLLRRT
jgi:hypothetical protein